MQPDEASYFVNIAAIGGTLVGLTFAILSFFLVDLLKRFEATALPVFRSRDTNDSARPSRSLNLPDSLNDIDLFDGDPLVIFIAFSVAVTWILFLFPLMLGLTAAWTGERTGVLGGELFFLTCTFAFSFITRNKAINKLKPYLTREELLWPFLGGILLALYIGATAIVVASAFPHTPRLAFWRLDMSNAQTALFVIKFICILSLLIGTYTTNKDMFVFFKSIATERMRQHWLEWFVTQKYNTLKLRVDAAQSRIPMERRDELVKKWNGGCPEMISTHDAFVKSGQRFLKTVWREIIDGRSGAPSWMLDVPGIANWAAELEELLQGCEQGLPPVDEF